MRDPITGRHPGVRPMFGENTPNLETFIFDFSGDLYGSTLSVVWLISCVLN